MELPTVHLPKVHTERHSQDDFMRDMVEGSNIAIQYLALAVSIEPSQKLDKIERAVLIGHMVRMFKLYDSYILLIAEQRAEIAMILARPLVETILNLSFLLAHGTADTYSQYQKASLAYEKKLWDEIEQRKHTPPLPIETRMQRSIEDAFARAGFKLEEVAFKDRNWGGGAFQKAEKLGLVDLYEFGFRTASQFVHGTWHELEFYHLTDKPDGHIPQPDYTTPNPQLLSLSILCLDLATKYVSRIVGEAGEEMVDRLCQIAGWFLAMQDHHERFLKAEPQT